MITSRVSDLADSIVLLHGWRRSLVALAAGALSVLALPPLFVLPVLLLTLPVLVLLLDGADADPPKAWWKPGGFFLTGWWFGFGYFLAGLYWISEALLVDPSAHGWLMPFALLLIPGGLALFIGAATWLAGLFWTNSAMRVLLLAATLAATEWLRGTVLSGFPWNGFHLALAAHDALIQGFSLVGPHAATLVVLIVAMSPAALWPGQQSRRGGHLLLAGAVLLGLGWAGYGVVRLAGDTDRQGTVGIRIVQPNIGQSDKWDPQQREQHFATLMEMTGRRTGPQQLGSLGADIVFWPESAFPFLIAQRPDALAAIGSALPLGSTLVAGAIRSEMRGDERVFYNAIHAFNDRGEIIDAYDKVRLVPFGEMMPLADWFDALGLRALIAAPSGFVAGSSPGALRITAQGQERRGLGLICYEAIFPAFVRQGVLQTNPAFLINLTNDAWFGSSAGPHQHLHQARLRAVESGRPMIRAANTGISAVIDAYGKVRSSLPVGIQGILDSELPVPLTQTPYLSSGNLPFALMLAMVLMLCVYHQRMKSARRSLSDLQSSL